MKEKLKVSRRPAKEAESTAAIRSKPRFRKLIDKDEIEDIVTAALLTEEGPGKFIYKFCDGEGYTGKAMERVRGLVEQVYKIRKAQQGSKK